MLQLPAVAVTVRPWVGVPEIFGAVVSEGGEVGGTGTALVAGEVAGLLRPAPFSTVSLTLIVCLRSVAVTV